MVEYEAQYEQQLDPKNPSNWGVHPYFALNDGARSELAGFRSHLPGGGVSDQIWFTEVGAYNCYYRGSKRVQSGESQQAAQAQFLVDQLMPALQPAHVFYYYFLPPGAGQPPCTEHPYEADDALYVPGPTPNLPAGPRPAAAMIFDNKWLPWAYTETGSRGPSASATLSGSVYPGGSQSGLLETRYHFEFGPSASYGFYSAEGDAGSARGRRMASVQVSGLQPRATYHYRLVAWNSEGTSYGGDYILGTETASSGPAIELEEHVLSAGFGAFGSLPVSAAVWAE
jgi:hypothetical protein